MKILYVVSRPLEINTSASIRNRATILGLIENGHEVEVLTTQPDENQTGYDASLSVHAAAKTQYIQLGGVQSVARLGRKLAFLKTIRRWAYRFAAQHSIYDSLKGFAAHADKVSLREAQYDLIISSSDPKSSHLFVDRLLKQQRHDFKGKWIQIWGDPFAGDITRKATARRAEIRREEHRLLLAADRVMYVSPLTLLNQQKMYPDCANKMFACPIPYEKEMIHEIREHDANDTIHLLYCGDYDQGVRNMMPLYQAVREMERVHLTICGGSDAPVESCKQVTVYPRISHAEVIRLEEEADVLVHVSNLRGSQIPGKIYHISATNKPILFILDGDRERLFDLFAPYKRYDFADNSCGDIQAVIKMMISQMGKTEYKPVKEFARHEIAAQIIAHI